MPAVSIGEEVFVNPASLPLSEYDTIISGAGPAGIMAARHAARRGRVLLVESSALPRTKSCGGMLHEHAQRFLSELADLPDSLIRDPSHVHFRYWDWDRGIRKPTSLRFLNVDRKEFDEWLLSTLPDNVDILTDAMVTDYSEDVGGVTVHVRTAGALTQARAANLVGCDGARSRIRRSMGVPSVSTYVTLQDHVIARDELEPFFDCIYMRDIGDAYAYSYVVPKGETAIVGSVYYPKTKRPHERQDQTLEILRAACPAIGETVTREASVALYVRNPADVVCGSGRVLLAGEAGGFMSPTSGEGISYALNSGVLAGKAIARSEPQDALAAYRAESAHISANIRRKLRWLPFMESRAGKYLAGWVPAPVISQVTRGL